MSDQLTNIRALLAELSEINDDLHHGRDPELIRKRIAQMRAILDRMEATL